MLRRLIVGLVLLFVAGCSASDAATTFPVLEPVGDIVAQECPVPEDWLYGAPSALGVCTDFPLGVFGAARVPVISDLMPEFGAGSECLLLWSDTGGDGSAHYSCYSPGGEPLQPQFGSIWDDTNHGYTYVAVLVPEAATRVIASTTDGTDLVAVPSQGIALLWWPGGAEFVFLYAETPSGQVELSPG